MNTLSGSSQGRCFSRALGRAILAALLTSLPSGMSGRTITGPEINFVKSGEPLFPAGNINVFKQYLLQLPRLKHSVGKSVEIDLLFDSYKFGGSLTGGIGGSQDPLTEDATLGFEVGVCIGGNAMYDLKFAPSVTLPDKYPWGVALPLTVSEGFNTQTSFFQTNFPPLGKAYADLIFDLGLRMEAEACVFGCTNFGVTVNTCDIPHFQLSKRCDPFLTERAFCAFELASFNRDDDACLRVLNVKPDRTDPQWLAKWLQNPYIEICPKPSPSKTFTADHTKDTLVVTGFANGDQVTVTSSGALPQGLFANKVYHVVRQNVVAPGTIQLSTRRGGQPVDFSDDGTPTHEIMPVEADDQDSKNGFSGEFGEISIGVPTITTNSSESTNNTSDVLRSSGSGDLMGLGINVPAVISAIIPAALPPLSDSGSVGPIDWNYDFASLVVGPAIQLQTDFELTWDLEVTELTFTEPPTGGAPGGAPRPVTLVRGSVVTEVANGSFIPANEGIVMHLTNCPVPPSGGLPCEPLPMIKLPDENLVAVGITYRLRPKLKAVVSTPLVGKMDYAALQAGVSIKEVGGLGFGPLIEGSHKFKLGEFVVYDGDPSEIASTGTGSLSFTLKAEGPPRFEWAPGRSIDWSSAFNWDARLGDGSVLTDQGPPTPGSFASILTCPGFFPDFFPYCPEIAGGQTVRIQGLQVAAGAGLNVNNNSDLVVEGGLIENSGTIGMLTSGLSLPGFDPPPGWITLDTPDSVLCGPGEIKLREGGGIRPSAGAGASGFTLCNYNTISGGGDLMVVPPGSTRPYDLIHLWDFEGTTVDSVSGANGTLLNGAVLNGAGQGHSGRGLQLGTGNKTMKVSQMGPLNRAAAGDRLSISFWQKLNTYNSYTSVYGEAPSTPNEFPNYDPRGLLAHTPFGDSRVIYFDTAGCCGPTTERINTAPLTSVDFLQWRHIVLVKDGSLKQIWVDGVKVAEGVNTDLLPTDYETVWIGSGQDGGGSIDGVLDEFAVFGLPLDPAAINLLATGTRPDALPFSGEESGSHLIHNVGEIRAENGVLDSNGADLVNLGTLGAKGSGAAFNAVGGTLVNRAGSRVISDGLEAGGSFLILGYDQAKHAGQVHAIDGGSVDLLQRPGAAVPASWDAGQSFGEDVGCFRSEGAGSNIKLEGVHVRGGILETTRGGSLNVISGALPTGLTGSILHIGGCNSPILDERFRSTPQTRHGLLTPQLDSGLMLSLASPDLPKGWLVTGGATGPKLPSFEPGVFFGPPYFVDLANVGFPLREPSNLAIMIWDDLVVTLNNPIPGSNAAGVEYQVDFDAGPAVLKEASQKTTASDSLLVEVLRADNSVLESFLYAPGAWSGWPTLTPAGFLYTGDGSGDIRLRLRSGSPGSGHFAGTIDNLTVAPSVASAESGRLNLQSTGAPGQLQGLRLDNHGTISVTGPWEAHDSMLFANHGKVRVAPGGSFRIFENLIATPGASAETRQQPGTANASANTLMGGTWEVEGALLIDGAAFTALGANTVPAGTGFGSINDLGSDPDHSAADRDLRFNPQDALCQQMSDGAPARVILRGPGASFPALASLERNEGELTLDNSDLALPGPLMNVGSAVGDEIAGGRGRLTIQNGGTLSFPGKFVQSGAASTTVLSGGSLLSGSGEYEIHGGDVSVASNAHMFNMEIDTVARRIPTGTAIRIESAVVDSDEPGSVGRPVPIFVSFGGPLSGIRPGGSLTIKGSTAKEVDGDIIGEGIFIPGLESLASVSGTFRLEGEGAPYSPSVSLGNLTNSGTVEVLGRDSYLNIGTFTQNGGSIRVGSESRVRFGSGSVIAGGEIVVEIDSRPRSTVPPPLGPISFGAPFDFNNKLVIDFTGEIAESLLDIGDSWQIVARGPSVTGVDSVEYRLNGAPLPGDWLPAGAELQTSEYLDEFGNGSGLRVRVVPAGGELQSYVVWATEPSRDLDPTNPFGDGNGNGAADLQEFLFGVEGVNRAAAGGFLDPGLLLVANAQSPSGEDRFFELSYVRPRPVDGVSPDVSFVPYYSEDLKEWFVASMEVTEIGPGPDPDHERVSLRSITPFTAERMFMRIQANYNPDDFEYGLIPEKPLGYFVGFQNLYDPANPSLFSQVYGPLMEIPMTYGLEPGRVLFFQVTGDADGGSISGTGVYRDSSWVPTAAVHAGVLHDGERGVVKVTFGAPLASYPGSVRNGVTSTASTEDRPHPLSYTIERVNSVKGGN